MQRMNHRDEGAFKIEEEFMKLKRLNDELIDENQNLQEQLEEKLEIIHDLKKLITSLEDSLVFRAQEQRSLQGSIRSNNRHSAGDLEGSYPDFAGEGNLPTITLSSPPCDSILFLSPTKSTYSLLKLKNVMTREGFLKKGDSQF